MPPPERQEIHLHITLDSQIIGLLQQILVKEREIMASIQDVADAVSAESTVVDSVVTLLDQLSAQLAAAIAANDPAAIQAVLDQVNAEKQTLADAVVANTPAA